MNLKTKASPPLKMTLVLEPLSSGQFVASILEFPRCRVAADTKEAAIAKIRPEAIALLSRIEVIPLEINRIIPG
jgi:predicted RNase H-like HicB family nuclease